MAKLTFTKDVPKEFKPADRERLADAVIEFIHARTTKENLDKRNKKFKDYSEEYVKSLDFKNAGKSKGKVNLELSGDMLAEMALVKSKSGSITIGYGKKADKDIKGRVEGNITGIRGKSPKKKNARDFLGITDKDYKTIVNVIKKDVKSDEKTKTGSILDLAFAALLERRAT